MRATRGSDKRACRKCRHFLYENQNMCYALSYSRIGAARSWAAAVKRKGKDHFPRNTLKNNAIGAIGNLDFVASGFDFVACWL